jgi:hypothetical protein
MKLSKSDIEKKASDMEAGTSWCDRMSFEEGAKWALAQMEIKSETKREKVIQYCVCKDECLRCFHKDAKCKKLTEKLL